MFDIPEPPKASVYEWVKDYSELAKEKLKEYKPTRLSNEWVADEMIRRAFEAAGKKPRRIRSDRLPTYKPAVDWLGGGKIKHIQSQCITAAISNNFSEPLQGTFRERAKTLRGLETIRTGQQFLDGWVINYNQFRARGTERQNVRRGSRNESAFQGVGGLCQAGHIRVWTSSCVVSG